MTALVTSAGLIVHKVTASVLALVLGVFTALPARDEIRDQQWHLGFLNIEQAHTISTGAGVIVGVVDTGVDGGHPDLAGRLERGADLTFLRRSDAWEDLDGHGTAMAGLVVANGRALGVAPDATVLPVRRSTDNLGSSSTTAEAIDWAVEHGATVLCLAFTFAENPAGLQAAIARAIAADVVVVAGVGNAPDDQGLQYPAAYQGVIGAAGVDRDGSRPQFSVVGAAAVLAAPAVEIMTTRARNVVPDGYGAGSGTSDATAIIAGVAALVRAAFPDLSAAEVVRRLTLTADDRGAPGRDDEYGFGIVNPVAALTADIPPLQPTDVPVNTSTQVVAPPDDPGGGTGLLLAAVAIGVGVVVLVIVGLVLAQRRR